MTSQPETILPGNSPSELKADPLLFRLFLHYVPDSIIKEAEHRKDTWQFLLSGRNLPDGLADFFKAGASVSIAAKKLLLMQCHGATLNRNLLDEMLKASAKGNETAAKKAAEKLLRATYKWGCWRGDFALHFKNQEERIQVEQLLEKEDKRHCKQYGRNWRLKLGLPSRQESESQFQSAYFMVHAWLRWGYNEPGLCFYSDETLADILSLLRRETARYGLGTRIEHYRKLRQRLGLEQLYYRKPTVTKARPVPGTGLIVITCRTENGMKTHTLSPGNGCSLSGRQFYPIPS